MSDEQSAFGPWDVEFEFGPVELEVIALWAGIPLADLSAEFEPHLVRGDE